MKKKSIKYYGKIRNYHVIDAVYRSRSVQLQILAVCVALAIGYRLYDLQVVSYTRMQMLSDENRITLLSIKPYRGRIFDRNGKILADNKISYQLSIQPIIKRRKGAKIIADLAKTLKFDYARSIELYDRNKRFLRRQQPVPFVTLDDNQVAKFATLSFRYPEIELTHAVNRFYPFKSHAVHLLGHVGRTDEHDLQDPHLFSDDGLNVKIDYVGKNGVERHYDRLLRGKFGHEIIEINAKSKKIRTISLTPATSGQDLQLTIDIRLQKFIDEKIQSVRGAVVMLDVLSGGILALSSAPSYDNNSLVSADNDAIMALNKNSKKPFLNRATHGLYPPASTIKPFVALAGLHYNELDANKKFFAGPTYKIAAQKRVFHDWKVGGHGWVDLDISIAQSCDVYFYDLAYRLGINRLYDYLSQFSFGVKTGIDLPGEAIGILPNREWKHANWGSQWLVGETVITGIGQGYFLVTPLQLAVATASLANQGKVLRPHLIRDDANQIGNKTFPQVKWYETSDWQKVIATMHSVVAKPYGTAYKVMQGTRYDFAAKTGTSQVISLAQDPIKREKQKEKLPDEYKDHSMFIAFAPLKNPKVAVAVVVENGGNGSGIAATITREVLDLYFQLYANYY